MTTTETHPQLEEVLRLRAQGMSVRAIAAAIGMSRAYVGQLVQGIGTRAPVALDLLDDNPWQPRAAQDAASLEGLAQSILDNGLLQLPGARAQGERFQLAFGHRRRDALKLLHSRGQWGETVTVTLQPFTDEQMAVIAFAENDDRQDLTDIERLRAYRHALDTIEGLTVAGLAAQLKMDRSTLANNLRVLALPQEALEHIAPGELGLHAARTMLPLVGPGHTHLAELRWVLRTLAGDSYGDGRPDWRVKTVEGLVGEVPQRFSQQWRPLFTQGQRAGNPKFDVEAFSLEHQNAVHMLPAGASGTAQPWTCAVSAWSTAQGKATRQEHQTAAGTGVPLAAAKPPSRDRRLQEALAKHPVAVSRETDGTSGNASAEALGSLATLHHVSYASGWHRLLQVANAGQYHPHSTLLPPWFPDVKECLERCTIGAAYATSQGDAQPALYCFNREHYQEKSQAGLTVWRERLERQKELDRAQNAQLVEAFAQETQGLQPATARQLARALIAPVDSYPWVDPVGDGAYAYEHSMVERVRHLLGLSGPSALARVGFRGQHPAALLLEALEQAKDAALPEIIGCLVVYQLRSTRPAPVSRRMGAGHP